MEWLWYVKRSILGLTFNEFADSLLNRALTLTSGASRIDIVFDVYRPHSIKNAERGHRSVGKVRLKTIVGAAQIKQWGAILSDGENKMELIRFLVNRWKSHRPNPARIPLYVAYDDKCICITTHGSHPVRNLESNQEADTRMLLHAKDVGESFPNVIIHTPDTDVLVIALAASTEFSTSLYIRTGTKGRLRIISIQKIKSSLSSTYDINDIELAAKAILSMHAFTGCDTVSAFSGKGKVKPLKVLLKNSDYINAFAEIGNAPGLEGDQLNVIEQFVCDIYGHKGCSTNSLRYKIYCSKQGKLEAKSIPPCLDSLKLHASRANYQAFVWRQSLIAKPEIPAPLEYGWEMEDGAIAIKWNTVKPAPEEVLELMFCTCSRRCVQESCLCIQNGLFCTDACLKKDCENYLDEDDVSDELGSDEEDDEYDE